MNLKVLITNKKNEINKKYKELGEHNRASEMANMLACDTQTEIDDLEEELKGLEKINRSYKVGPAGTVVVYNPMKEIIEGVKNNE